ncbi:hypothetical protein MD484_g683, partial [Candolleomyces efflorescens]
MVKISALQHDPAVHVPLRPGDPTPIQRNLNPSMHPFAKARERTRALNAAKLDKIFSKPFVDSLEGHIDAVEVLAKPLESLTTVASGSWDGARLTTIGQILSSPLLPAPSKYGMKPTPISNLTFPTSNETVSSVRFNLAEPSVLASVGSDRTFTLYDIRTGKAERRVVMQIYKGHVAAVMSCDWAPTGVEFVSGGWDRTVRIWSSREAGGREKGPGGREVVYHTKRMQRVTSTIYSSDARYILSGSDDGNVRIWKAKASDKLGVITGRERAAMEYRESLTKRWSVDKEVGRVMRTRHLPKAVYKASQLKTTMLDARRVKEERRRKHTRAGESKPVAEKKKVIVTEQS